MTPLPRCLFAVALLVAGGNVAEAARTASSDALKVAPWFFSVEEAVASAEPALKLDLSGQDLEALPPALFQLASLELLVLNGNRLATLPPELAGLQKLSELEVNDNQLEQFPVVILALTQLNELELNGNRLRSLPEGIGRLTQLTELEARENRLAGLPASLASMTRLEELKLDGNHLSSIPAAILELPRLIEITLAHNELAAIEADWRGNRSLRELDLSANRLTELPAKLLELPLDTCKLWQPTLPRLDAEAFRWLLRRPVNDAERFALGHAESGETASASYYLDLLREEAKRKGPLAEARGALLAAKVHRSLRETRAAERAAEEALAHLRQFFESDEADEGGPGPSDAEALRARVESLRAQTEAEILNQRLGTLFRLFLLSCVATLSAFLLTLIVSRRRLQAAHRQLAAQKATIEDQAARLRRLNATKDRLFSIIGHDLRNPFAAIRGLAARWKREAASGSATERERQADLIAAAALEAGATLENLLSWARSEDGSLELSPAFLDVAALVRGVLELHGPNLMARDLRCETDCEPELRLWADRRTLEGALRNLVSNAIKFTPPGGRIRILARQEGDEIVLRVEDSGLGVDPAVVGPILSGDPASPTPPPAGRGLGLILCREFVARNDGILEVESVAGEGASFVLRFPLSALPVGIRSLAPGPALSRE